MLGLNGRNFNNDATAIHEQLILDVNAGVKFLRDQGCEKVVLFGNSGGGSLSALFQAQAQLPKGQRIAHAPRVDAGLDADQHGYCSLARVASATVCKAVRARLAAAEFLRGVPIPRGEQLGPAR